MAKEGSMTDKSTDTPIETILGNSDAPKAAETPAIESAEGKGSETGGQARDDRGRFAAPPSSSPVVAPTGAPIATAPPAVAPQKPTAPEGYVPVAALVDMRLEAREAKRNAEDMRRRLAEYEAQKNAPPPVDFFSDPDAALNQRIAPLRQSFEQEASKLRFRASRAEAIAEFGKESVLALEKFADEASASGDAVLQELQQVMLQSEHPVGAAMQWFKKRSMLSEIGDDPAAYREKLKAEILAELQGTGAQAPQKTPPPVMPSNLAGVRNVGSRSGPTWSGPTPLADIFKR